MGPATGDARGLRRPGPVAAAVQPPLVLTPPLQRDDVRTRPHRAGAADPPPFNYCFVELLGTRKYGYDLSH